MLLITHSEVSLETLRLQLSPMMASHAKVMYPILSDRQLYFFTGDEPPESVSALEERYRYLEGRKSPDESQMWLNWIVALQSSDTAIGYIQATISQTHAEIAWVIGLDWQGKGYASEAVSALVAWLKANEVDDIRCSIHPEHVASQGVASNCGLKKSDLLDDSEEVWLSTLPG